MLGSIRYLPLNAGEAWGHLRIFPTPGQRLAPTDIPVFEELPLDLSVVAGVITKAVQDSNSHVNLKSKERGTPNMVLRDAGPDHPRLQPWRDQPVHFVVRADDFVLEATTDEEVARRFAERMTGPLRLLDDDDRRPRSGRSTSSPPARRPPRWRPPRATAPRRPTSASSPTVGCSAVVGQVGSLSEALGYDLVPRGVAVPLAFYERFVAHPPNAKLRARPRRTCSTASGPGRSPATASPRRSRWCSGGSWSPSCQPATSPRSRPPSPASCPGVDKVKVRSSANAEDIPNFDGAGLHDSFSAKLAKHSKKPKCQFDVDDDVGRRRRRRSRSSARCKPRTVACAVKGVYASLWNQRADRGAVLRPHRPVDGDHGPRHRRRLRRGIRRSPPTP